MLMYALILFASAMVGGLLVLRVGNIRERTFKLLLVFAGAYLFSITVIHFLPEILGGAENPGRVGLYVLIGFFLQMFLEYFTSGVEHGHLHGLEQEKSHSHSHHFTPFTLLIALCIHALLDGALLAHPGEGGHLHDTDALLAGVVLHKMPAAFALMSLLLHQLGSGKKAIGMLTIFALASPVGLFLSHFMMGQEEGWQMFTGIIYPLVAGSFLHISTTIFIENSPEHNFNLHKLIASLAGALIAVVAELLA
ncbi:ZIP family metal transporter [Nafulsella turpanensis]|uniref:ZIP family metal transporter n=1 Tax=Nafulsella turpanensis TaxID=1265690 RepID=UPI00034879CC|nr:ZIP family metal transporter [Nafulsella turpanensis]